MSKRKRDVAAKGANTAPGSSSEEGLHQFRKALQELRSKAQTKIMYLTNLADSLHEVAVDVVQILFEEISAAPPARVQSLVSVVDSVLKKVGKAYKTQLSKRLPDILEVAWSKSDANQQAWLRRMVSDSWRRHELLPLDVLVVAEQMCAAAVAAPLHPSLPAESGGAIPHLGAVPALVQSSIAVKSEADNCARSGVVDGSAGQLSAGASASSGSPPSRPPVKQPPPAQRLAAVLAAGYGLASQEQEQWQPVPGGVAAPAVETASAQTPSIQLTRAATAPPPVKGPPPVKVEVPAEPISLQHGQSGAPTNARPRDRPKASAAAGVAPSEEELVERRLNILTKIIERKSPAYEELQEIMRVPEIRKAIILQQGGQRPEAMALLSQFKQTLEKKQIARREGREGVPEAVPTEVAAAPSASLPDARQPADPRRPEDQMQLDPRSQPERAVAVVPRQADPRRPESRHAAEVAATGAVRTSGSAMDPRRLEAPQPEGGPEARQGVDPRQPPDATWLSKPSPQPLDATVAKKLADPRQSEGNGDAAVTMSGAPDTASVVADPSVVAKRSANADVADPRTKLQRIVEPAVQQTETPAASPPTISADDVPFEAVSEEENDKEPEFEQLPNGQVQGLAAVRQVLQGLPSLGFSEGWLRQFMEQMPTQSLLPQEGRKREAVVGRKVLSARGDQMVYVDELCPSEVLLLMQLVFLLEERLRRGGGGVDLAQRIPHTFGYLQVEPAIDVMLKRFFDELPHQCTTTGLRFATREKLRKHHDALYRRRTLVQQRQRGAEARGWMESIPEWVGNRDLVVGPALFRLGGTIDDAPKAMENQRSREEDGSDEEDWFGEQSRWMVPLDERRSVCPVSGEPFERTWSCALNDWAFSDVVAVEPGSDRILRFQPAGSDEVGTQGGPRRLSETAVLFKKSCFFNTSLPKRLQAIEECGSINALALPGIPTPQKVSVCEDLELAALAQARPLSKKFF